MIEVIAWISLLLMWAMTALNVCSLVWMLRDREKLRAKFDEYEAEILRLRKLLNLRGERDDLESVLP